MKTALYCFLFLCSLAATGQKGLVLEKLNAYQFPDDILTQGLESAFPDLEHSFDVTITSTTDTEKIVEKARYNPKKKNGDRWSLEAINGAAPSKKEIKSFKREHGKKESMEKRRIDAASWTIDRDDAEYLVVGFTYDKSTLPYGYEFLKYCPGKAYLNKRTKRLEKAVFHNERPIKVWPLKVSELHMVVEYGYNESEMIYQVQKETMDMTVTSFGQSVPIKDVYEYSNYIKID